MIILALKTDTSETELVLLQDSNLVSVKKWQSGKSLAKDLTKAMSDFLKQNNITEVDGYIGYLGPGSFTGLRIGLSALNALSFSNNKPIVGADGDNWLKDGAVSLLNKNNDKILAPRYGADANITFPKK